MNWWGNAADKYGLDPQGNVTNKSFQVLPILKDLRKRIKV